ncbi:MAG: ankyrin repeat domain-containing protein [Candidatus Xenobiia bacterium LiM19]
MVHPEILFTAVNSGNVTLVRSILEEDSFLINDRDDRGCTPLIVAVEQDHFDTALYLLEKGAEANARDKEGYSALHVTRSLTMVTLLLSHGAEVDAADNYGLTPLHNAVIEGCTEIVEVLIEHGANVNSVEDKGFTPLKMAVEYKLPEIEMLLRRHGAH